MDIGHHNCRDYHISPEAVYDILNKRLGSTCLSVDHGTRRAAKAPASFAFLHLPLELRQQIYNYLLPSADNQSVRSLGAGQLRPPLDQVLGPSSLIWSRGQTSLLCVCHQVHDECAALLYGNNQFVILVSYDSISFRYRWLLQSGLAPSGHFEFLELVPPRYIRLLKHLVVYVDHVDSYTGMIKYNVGGKGLTHKLSGQVQKLVDALRAVNHEDDTNGIESSRLNSLRIKVSNGNDHLNREKRSIVRNRESEIRGVQEVQTVLSPFSDMRGIIKVEFEGAVTSSYADYLRKSMTISVP